MHPMESLGARKKVRIRGADPRWGFEALSHQSELTFPVLVQWPQRLGGSQPSSSLGGRLLSWLLVGFPFNPPVKLLADQTTGPGLTFEILGPVDKFSRKFRTQALSLEGLRSSKLVGFMTRRTILGLPRVEKARQRQRRARVTLGA